MKKRVVQSLALSSLTLGLLACSGGGGGGGGSSSTNVATGALSVPNLNCGASACLSSSASLMSVAVNSAEEIGAYGELVYEHFNGTSLPKINQMLYQLENAFKAEGLTTCAQIAAVPAGNEQLNATTNVVITAAGMTSPFSGSTTKTFEVVQSGDVTAVISIGCSGTVRHMYVKAEGESGNLYEVWVKTDSADANVKSVEAAADSGSAKLTIQFQATTATAFQIAAAGANYPNPYGGGAINFAIFGGADLGASPKKAHVSYTSATSTEPPTSWSANDANWTSATPIRHCYSNFDVGTVDASGGACSSVPGVSPTFSSKVRGNSGAITWTVDNLDSAIVAPN